VGKSFLCACVLLAAWAMVPGSRCGFCVRVRLVAFALSRKLVDLQVLPQHDDVTERLWL